MSRSKVIYGQHYMAATHTHEPVIVDLIRERAAREMEQQGAVLLIGPEQYRVLCPGTGWREEHYYVYPVLRVVEEQEEQEPDWHRGCSWCWRTIWHRKSTAIFCPIHGAREEGCPPEGEGRGPMCPVMTTPQERGAPELHGLDLDGGRPLVYCASCNTLAMAMPPHVCGSPHNGDYGVPAPDSAEYERDKLRGAFTLVERSRNLWKSRAESAGWKPESAGGGDCYIDPDGGANNVAERPSAGGAS